jgi:cold shock CspA family protein
MIKGYVKFYNRIKGYGFIVKDKAEYFFSHRDLKRDVSGSEIIPKESTKVYFEVEKSKDPTAKRDRAINVCILNDKSTSEVGNADSTNK